MDKISIISIIRSLFIHLCLYQHLKNSNTVGQTIDTARESSAFICENGKVIDFINGCDGIWNCEDGSDEKCDNEGILFYYSSVEYDRMEPECLILYKELGLDLNNIYRNDSFLAENQFCFHTMETLNSMNVTGVFLNDNKEFSLEEGETLTARIAIGENEIRISPYGSMIYTFLPLPDKVMRHGRNGVFFPPNARSHAEVGKNAVVDWLTSKIYQISNSQVEVCDTSFNKCINFLNGEFIKNPIFFVISVKYRLLFWIHKNSTSEYFLYACSLRNDGRSESTLVLQDLKTPKWLTIDPVTDRLYWLSNREEVLQFYSSTFEGTDVKVLSPGVPIPGTGDTSFAVFNGSIYWSDRNNRNIMKCSTNNCSTPTIFKEVPIKPHPPDTFLTNSSMGSLTIDYRSLTPSKIKEPCDRMCSHLCLPNLPTSETGYTCYCDGLNKSLPKNSINGYCKDETVIAAYQNSLYIVGLPKSTLENPTIHKNTINISSISDLAYNSIDGSVIVTETGKQRIYSWIPRSGELKLILDDELDGTINSIEFDSHANNLYWIDDEIDAIIVMNMNSRLKAIVLEGNSSYSLMQFTLVPFRGYMAVLFLKESSTIIIERISMDGGSYSRKIIYKDHKTYEPNREDFALHYMRRTQWIFLVDKQKNEIKYFSDKNSESWDLQVAPHLEGNTTSITSLRSDILLPVDDLTIHWSVLDDHYMVHPVRKISLGLKKKNSSLEATEDSFVRMTNVMQQITEPRLSKCLHNNGGCEKMCLLSNRPQRFVCFCPDGEQLVNDTHCMSQLELENSITTESEQEDLNQFNDSSTESGAKKEMTTLVQETKRVISTTRSACMKSCPICPKRITENAQFLNGSPSTGNSTHTFYSVFIAILALSLGVVAGYLIREKWLERRKTKLLNYGTLQLTRARTERICTTPTALDQDQWNCEILDENHHCGRSFENEVQLEGLHSE